MIKHSVEKDCGVSQGFRPNTVTDQALIVQTPETISDWPWTTSIGFYNVSIQNMHGSTS